jgi:hypothetical protein
MATYSLRLLSGDAVWCGVDWWKRDGHHSLRLLSGDAVWCGVDWLEEGWPSLTPSPQVVVNGCKRDGHCSLRLLSGGEVLRTG